MCSEKVETAGLQLSGAVNFRDIGGFSTCDGRYVRRGQLFRSDALGALTCDDLRKLDALNIRLICDLRSALERDREPTRWGEGGPGVLLMEIDSDLRSRDSRLLEIIRDDPTEAGAVRMLTTAYQTIPFALQRHLNRFFTHLADDTTGPLIIHCSAGKDRTGVLAAIVLQALGVNRDDIYKDYLLTAASSENLRDKVSRLMSRLLGKTLPENVTSAIAGVRASYLDAALAAIEGRFNTLDNYLDAAGVSARLLDQMRERYLRN